MSAPMDLKTFIEDRDRRRQLAEKLDTSEQYLWQLATGWRGRRPSPEMAQRIETATTEIAAPGVHRGAMRPDLWQAPQNDAQEAA